LKNKILAIDDILNWACDRIFP